LVHRPVPAQYAHFGSPDSVVVFAAAVVCICLIDDRFARELYLSLSPHQPGDPQDPREL
jgi:hypothetical protein